MKKNLTLLALALFAPAANAISFSDLQFWSGTGSQVSGLVLQWDTGTGSRALAWGFRHNGGTVEDMLHALVSADRRLFEYGETFSFGYGVYGLGYDADDSGITGTGYTTGATPDDAVANDPNDNWRSGWLSNGYWSLWDGAVATSTGAWTSASTGVSDAALAGNSWHALAFAPAANGWTTEMTSNIDAAPVPEPSAVLALGIALVGLLRWRKQ